MPLAQLRPAGTPIAAADAAVWHVRLLGGFEIDDGRHRISRLRSRAAMALLARVALAPARDHSREELAALLWPDADAVAGRNRLRQTLSLLKAVLEPPGGPAVLQADRRVVRAVAGALWCDAWAFKEAVRAGRRDLAGALYAGELLPGFYDEWVLDERQHLQALRDRLGDGIAAPGAAASASVATSLPTRPGSRWTEPRQPGNRLPQYLTRLIGADQQGARLQAVVAEHRLVVVLGAGGSGKTRLAVEVTRGLCEPMPGGPQPRFERPVFVSLIGAHTSTDLLDRLQGALRIETAGDAVEHVLQVLEGSSALVLLDNCEQLDDSAAATISHLAERLPSVHWLGTSRRPLGLDGEHGFLLEALGLPSAEAPLEDVALNAAVLLFVDRARAHRADFHVSAANRAAMVALVRWLEGLPLAIELAASHARTAGPAELLAVLRAARDDRRAGAGSLALLARRGARSGSDPRHASMLDVIAWSWRMLTPDRQQLLLALCHLTAGATLHAAAAMGGAAGQGMPLALAQATLDDLVAHSVVQAVAGQDGQWRYRPYEPVREYALSQLDDAALRAQRRRVLAWLIDWASALPATPPLPTVREELPNITQALAAAPADGAASDAARLVLMLQSSWGEIAVPAAGLQALDRLLQSPGLDDSLAAGGHALAAWSCQEAGRPDDTRRHMAQALVRPCPDPALRVMTLSRLARLHWRLDRNAGLARALIAEALPLARSAHQSNSEAALLSLEGHLSTVVDRDPARGAELTRQSLALWQRSGNRHLVNAGRFNLAITAIKANRPADVLGEFAALAEEGRELQDWDLASGALEARGTALLALRCWPEAWVSLRESLALGWSGMQILATVYALWNVAPVLARLRQAALAAQTMGAAEAQWRQRFGEPDQSDLCDLKRVRRFTRTLLGQEAAQAAWRTGAARPLGEAVRAVLDLPIEL